MKWTRNNNDLFLTALKGEKPKNQNKKQQQKWDSMSHKGALY